MPYGNSLFMPSGVTMFLSLFPIIVYILLAGLAVYFVIKASRYMNAKRRLDQERNERLNELIQAVKLKDFL
ncbi:hypothetical protein [Bacillus sp. 1P06AnD]|uniref:hypothetical protein n=1 Tax=Bacillus sp. 1P06AnD TaxID=3132208 RepID=UPI0039A1DBA0